MKLIYILFLKVFLISTMNSQKTNVIFLASRKIEKPSTNSILDQLNDKFYDSQKMVKSYGVFIFKKILLKYLLKVVNNGTPKKTTKQPDNSSIISLLNRQPNGELFDFKKMTRQNFILFQKKLFVNNLIEKLNVTRQQLMNDRMKLIRQKPKSRLMHWRMG